MGGESRTARTRAVRTEVINKKKKHRWESKIQVY